MNILWIAVASILLIGAWVMGPTIWKNDKQGTGL